MIVESEGAALVRLARKAVEEYITTSVTLTAPDEVARSGVFVTINQLLSDGESLRGCIGFPMAYKGLRQSVIEAAIAAATEDPRFDPIQYDELKESIFEVSVLTELEEIKTDLPSERRQKIVVGRDGLVLRWRGGSGLLLPQVPVEYSWDVDEYLANISYKAGAPLDAWLDPLSKLYRFEADVFREERPRGNVIRVGNKGITTTGNEGRIINDDNNNK